MTKEEVGKKIVDAIIKGWNEWSRDFTSRAHAERYWAKIIGEANAQADVIKSGYCVCSMPKINSDEDGFLFCDNCGEDVKR